jgi:putative endopeptidase
MSRFRRSALFGSAALILTIAASGHPVASQTKPDFLAANIDPATPPGEDFFQYATGAWLKRNPIPADQARWTASNVVSEELDARIRRISEAAAASNAPRGSNARLVGDFWSTGMDAASRNREGLTKLQPDLDRIADVQSIAQLIDVVAMLHQRNMLLDISASFVGSRTLFSLRVERDEQDRTRRILSLSQGGITLGAPAYTATDAQRTRRREAFREYLLKTFTRLHGDSGKAKASADAVFDLEAQLARGFVPREQNRTMAVSELGRLSPSIEWSRYLRGIDATGIDSVNVRAAGFFQALDPLLRTTPMDTWRDYLRFCLIRAHAPFLDDSAFSDVFAFETDDRSVRQPRPLWRRVVWMQKYWLGQATGQLLAEQDFPPTVQVRYREVAESIRDAFRSRITRLEWMSDATKQHALTKLARMTVTIGLEQKADLSTMPLRRDSYVLNMIRSAEWFHAWQMKTFHAPVPRIEVDMRHNVGGSGYYEMSANEIQIPTPAAVPGWTDGELDDAFVYAASSLGHEIAHAFDPDGRQYDADANKVDWWTPRDDAAFKERAQVMVDQYNEFMPVEGVRVNGQGSLNENLADLVGLRVALDAFKQTPQFKQNQKIGGFTPLQRFFLGYAHSHMGHERPESIAARINGNYAPNRERVNGVVVNIPEFYEAFGVKPGDRMYRAASARVNIW